MKALRPMDITRWKLPDDAFWDSDDRGSDAMAREPVGDFSGLLIDLPTRVRIQQRATLPAGIYHHGTIRELAAVTLPKLAALVAVNRDGTQIHVAHGQGLCPDDDELPSAPIDVSTLPEGDMSTTYGVDLRALFGLPWRPGRYRVRVLLRDVVSNPADVALVDGTEDAAERQAGSASGLAPQWSPSTLTLACPRIVNLLRGDNWSISGTVGLRLPAAGPDSMQAAGTVAPDPVPRPQAVHLLLTGADDGSVHTLTVMAGLQQTAPGQVEGRFEVDLTDRARSLPLQTYFVTAFAGDLATQPAPSGLLAFGP